MWTSGKEKEEEQKAEEKTTRRDEEIKKLEEFVAIGDKFKYLGVDMVVSGHSDWNISMYDIFRYPCLKARYVNKLGEIKNIKFDYDELKTLKFES